LDPNWASQVEVLKGFTAVASPDFVLREDELAKMLPLLGQMVGKDAPYQPAQPDIPIPLSDIYDAEIEQKVRAIYKRDYLNFGFGDWGDQAA
jgi:hypothetical protein